MGKNKKKQSRKAREDKELLKNLSMLARTGATLSESAEALGLTDKQLKDLFKKRRVLRTWREARLSLILHVRTALAKSAGEGKLPAI